MKTEGRILHLTYTTDQRHFIIIERLDKDIVSMKIGDPDGGPATYLLDPNELDALIQALNDERK